MGRGGLYGLSEQRLKLSTFQSPYAAAAAAAASLRYRFAPCYVPHPRVPFLSSSESVVGPCSVVWVMVRWRGKAHRVQLCGEEQG